MQRFVTDDTILNKSHGWRNRLLALWQRGRRWLSPLTAAPWLWTIASGYLVSTLVDHEDKDLVVLAQARGLKDDRPFRELWRRHQRMVWHICYSFMANQEDTEDLMQEVFLKSYRNLSGFEQRSSFKTWLNRITVNTAQNEVRRRSRRPQPGPTPVEEMEEYLPAAGASVERVYQQKRLKELVAATFAQLRPEEYEVLYLKDVEERPYAEIAELMGVGLSAAKMRVQRARLSFQTHFLQLQEELV